MAKEQDDSLKVITPEGRTSFVHVWEPHAFQQGQEPNFSLILVFDPETDISELKKAATLAAKKKFGDKAGAMFKSGKLRMPFRDGAEYEEYGEPFVKGATFITCKSKSAPGVVDHNAKPIMKQMDFYSGCYARASVYCHAYDSMGNAGVTFLLNNVQKTADGDKTGGRMSAESEFGASGKFQSKFAGKGGGAGKGGKPATFDDDDIPF